LANLFDGKRNPSMPKPAAAALKIVTSLKEFKDSVPIIRALCNPGLQQRHINRIFKEIGAP
jgi:hypothetical protein